jgi:hypothetical protein
MLDFSTLLVEISSYPNGWLSPPLRITRCWKLPSGLPKSTWPKHCS